jgi:hypothetical protein
MIRAPRAWSAESVALCLHDSVEQACFLKRRPATRADPMMQDSEHFRALRERSKDFAASQYFLIYCKTMI